MEIVSTTLGHIALDQSATGPSWFTFLEIVVFGTAMDLV
jgi:hypothetical protein